MKARAVRELSPAEITQKIKEANDALFKLKIQHAGKQLTNPMKIMATRREKARMITILKEKNAVKVK